MQEPVKASQQIIKEANMRLVFGLISKHEAISRADIKKQTGLSATTVSSLVEELMEEGFVAEGGTKTTGTSGRKAVLLHVKADGGYFVGVDVRKGQIVADTYALDFSPVFHIAIDCESSDGFALSLLRAISTASRGRRILGITVGLPAVIDSASNTVVSSTVIDAETARNVYTTVADAMPGVKIFLRNNSGLIAYAEKEFGKHGDINNLVSIDIDDGVGAGIILGGAMYNGANGMAGELGHVTIDYNGKRCQCGSYGCLELVASVPSILEQTGHCTLDDLKASLDAGDEHAYAVAERAARALAFGINNIINIVDPEFIVIGGSVRILGDYLITPLKKYITEISFTKDKTIVYSELECNTVTLGGARFSFDEMFGV